MVYLTDQAEKKFISCEFLEGVAWSVWGPDNPHIQEAFSALIITINNVKFSNLNLILVFH